MHARTWLPSWYAVRRQDRTALETKAGDDVRRRHFDRAHTLLKPRRDSIGLLIIHHSLSHGLASCIYQPLFN